MSGLAQRIVLAVCLTACGGGSAAVESEPPDTVEESASSDRERAIEVARTVAEREGVELADYQLDRAELTDGRWLVTFVVPPPTPPGGHFGVLVDPATWQGELMPGE